jgi:dynein heavy chain
VPILWSKKAYPSLKPLATWYDDLVLRVEFFRKWTNDKPRAFWISAFFFP